MNKRYVIALSFANYLKDKTGIPKVMVAHQQMYNQNKISYVALFTVKKNIFDDKIMLFCKFGLIIDGEYKGIYQMSQLIHMFSLCQVRGNNLLDIHIHHLMYTNVNLLEELLQSCPGTPVKVYLHDYYNACTGYTLLKNGDTFCGGNGFSDDCIDCRFYKKNVKIQMQIHSFFMKNIGRIVFVSPSQTTKNIFTNFHPEYSDKIIVIPHQKYDARYTENLEEIGKNEKVRVAFLGMPMKHKGWNAWKGIVDRASAEQYEFAVFNSSDDTYPKMEKFTIEFNKENLNAMTDALRKYKVHIVVLWAIWPETYSYTCFEAFSANAFIITNSNSGNIADVVRANENGLVLSNEEELQALFVNVWHLKDIINSYKQSTIGGPKQLYENDEIIKWTLQDEGYHKIIDFHKLVDYPLLWILNVLYRM